MEDIIRISCVHGIHLHDQRGKLLEDLRCRTHVDIRAMVLGGSRNLETQISEGLNNVKKVQVKVSQLGYLREVTDKEITI